jgi:hypothetical protein
MCGGSLQAAHLTELGLHDFQSFHKDSLVYFEAASVFCIHRIGKGPNRKNLGKVLLVLKSAIGACYNLIHYDIEYIYLIVNASRLRALGEWCCN